MKDKSEIINPYKEYIKSKDELWQPHGAMKDADFSRALGSKKLAIHWVELPPNQRSSYPHAESAEEEVIYVVSGNPHVWVNGYIYLLESGLIVCFPGGTGIAHTFINNSNEAVEMIVLGERTKKENKCSFPINPELHSSQKEIWWDELPEQTFGPHNGQPGNLQYQKSWQELSFIKKVSELERQKSFSYPGDNEIFSQGVRLTNHLNLKTLAVWHEIMKSGKRSSWPHAHLIEEEFAIILKGTVKAWLNGFVSELKPGDCVYFKPGTNISHTLLNESLEDVEFLVIGQNDLSENEDKIFYPLHSSRNSQCQESGWLWEDRPAPEYFGQHLGLPLQSNQEYKFIKFANAQEFLDNLKSLLYKNEAEYSLMLGLAELKSNSKVDNYSYIALYQNNNAIGACLVTEKNLILTNIPGPLLFPLAQFLHTNNLKFPGVVGPSVASETFARAWNNITNVDFKLGMAQKIYQLVDAHFPENFKGRLESATLSNLELIADWLYQFTIEALPHEPITKLKSTELARTKIEKGEVFIWIDENSNPVTMNFVGRPTKNGISVSAVYTPIPLRKRGYASALVAHTSQLMLNNGKTFCVLYTDLANPTSNKIYQRIGYKEVAISRQFIFGV